MISRRVYRSQVSAKGRLTYFTVNVKESDLWIAVSSSIYSEALPAQTEQFLWKIRRTLEAYLEQHKEIRESFEPTIIAPDAPELLLTMARAGNAAGVGPMAAVAGAIAEAVGKQLRQISPEVIVENGGDVFVSLAEPAKIGIFAGNSPLSGRLAIKIDPSKTPLGICTSSGTIGPSFSSGNADAAVVLSRSTAFADAAATALGNMVKGPDDLNRVVDHARQFKEIAGVLLICGDKIALWGDVELQRL